MLLNLHVKFIILLMLILVSKFLLSNDDLLFVFSSGQNQMNAGPQHHQHLHHHLHHYHHPPRFHHFPVAPGMPSEFGPVVSCHGFLFVCFVCLFICLIFFGGGCLIFNYIYSHLFFIASQVWIFYFVTNFGKFSQ